MTTSTSIYKQLLSLQTATFSAICHEDAMVATVYKITKPNAEQLILKISERPHDYLREVLFLKRFASTLPVPKIIGLVEPTEEIHGAILMEYFPGALLKTNDLTEPLAYDLGHCLALIHLGDAPGYGDPMCGHFTPEPRSYFTFKFEEGLEECRIQLPAALLEKCLNYYKAHIDLLDAVDGPCIAHRDFRPGNIIVNEGKLIGIIDWAGARASFAEEDFCSIEHGAWLQNPSIKKSFLKGYATVRPLPNYKPLIPFLRLNKAIATLGFTIKQGTWSGKGSRIYQYNRQFLEDLFKSCTCR